MNKAQRISQGALFLLLFAQLDAVTTLGAGAQQRDTTRVPQDTAQRPFVRGGMYDKPFLATLGGRTAIGGYAEAHARWHRVDGLLDEATFVAKRFNLFTNTRVSDFVRIGAELEFEEGGEEIKLEYAAIDFLISPSLAFRGGMVLSPLGKFNLSHDSPLNEFTDRPVVSTDLLGVALSEPGFGAFGQIPLMTSGRVTYEVYATNGFHDGLITESEDGTRIAFGRANFEDNNNSAAFVGRVAVSPSRGFELGISTHRGAYNVFELEGARVDDRRTLAISAVDFEAEVAGVMLTGEGALVSIDVPADLSGIFASRQRGAYVDAIYPFGNGWVNTMPQSHFAAKVRYDRVDFDSDLTGQSLSQVTVGLNFRPTSDTAIKFDFVRGRSRDEFNNLSEHASLLFSIATYF